MSHCNLTLTGTLPNGKQRWQCDTCGGVLHVGWRHYDRPPLTSCGPLRFDPPKIVLATPAASGAKGPGSKLGALLAARGVSICCKRSGVLRQLDRWGDDECRRRRAWIVERVVAWGGDEGDVEGALA